MPPAGEFSVVRGGTLLLGGLSLLAGLDAALLRSGLAAPVRTDRLPEIHGILMVLGFLGTLIAQERAVALRQPWGYLAPATLGVGALALLSPAPLLLGQLLLVDGCLLLIAVYAGLWQRAHDHVVLVQLVAAVAACCAAVLWLRIGVDQLLGWLVVFIVLTIAAERVELARLTLPRIAPLVLLALAAALLGTAVLSLLWPGIGARLLGLTLLVGTLWLARHDIARRTVRASGLPRFSAVALLLGYGWLAVAGLIWLVGGPPTTRAAYDTVVHAVFLGFAMSMVLAHAPIILPAVLRVRLPYRPVLWLPLVLLHTALVLRVGVGNGMDQYWLWQLGAIGTVLALLLLPLIAGGIAATSRQPAEQHSRLRPVSVPEDRG